MEVRFKNLKHRKLLGWSLSARQEPFISWFPEGSDPGARFQGDLMNLTAVWSIVPHKEVFYVTFSSFKVQRAFTSGARSEAVSQLRSGIPQDVPHRILRRGRRETNSVLRGNHKRFCLSAWA